MLRAERPRGNVAWKVEHFMAEIEISINIESLPCMAECFITALFGNNYVYNFFLYFVADFPHCYCFMSTGAGRLMLGSFYQPNRWDHDLSISAPYIQSMLRRCKEICPRLNILKDSDIQVTVGIRPARKHKYRLEQDP